MAALIAGLLSAWSYVMRAAPILLAVLLAVASYFTALRAGIRLWDDSPAGSPNTPDYFVEGFTWLRVKSATGSRTEMTGKLLTHIPSSDTLTLTPLQAMRQSIGSPPLRVWAQNAVMNNMTGEIQLKDEVRVNRQASATTAALNLSAPRMMLETDSEVLHAYESVTLRRGDQELKTSRLTFNNLTGQVTAEQRVFLFLPPAQKQDTR